MKTLILLILASFSFVASSYAQSCDVSALGTCLFNSALACKTSVINCSANKSAGFNVPEIEDAAIEKCCRFGGKTKAKEAKSKACFQNEERKLNLAYRDGTFLRPFIRQSKNAIAALRKGKVCTTGSLN